MLPLPPTKPGTPSTHTHSGHWAEAAQLTFQRTSSPSTGQSCLPSNTLSWPGLFKQNPPSNLHSTPQRWPHCSVPLLHHLHFLPPMPTAPSRPRSETPHRPPDLWSFLSSHAQHPQPLRPSQEPHSWIPPGSLAILLSLLLLPSSLIHTLSLGLHSNFIRSETLYAHELILRLHCQPLSPLPSC